VPNRSRTTPPSGAFRRPAAFLDRDGILNKDSGYAYRPDQIVWIDGAHAAVKLLKDAGYHVFVVTNQTGIARDLYTEQHVQDLHAWMNGELGKSGTGVDDFRYSPHHPEIDDGRFTHLAHWRKPHPGMLMDLAEKWPIQWNGSFMIGDRDTDVLAAEAAGIPGFLFEGGNLLQAIRDILDQVDRP
jgi:D-glycero-D-manno-heptose 1,7-bisphosphate phosphatase